MRVRWFNLITDIVETGIEYGYARAHKHVEVPTEDVLKYEIYNAVVNELCERIDFGSLGDGCDGK